MDSIENVIVTILIPVYNGKDYLERAVRSACEQTYSHLEIVIVDDGSTDGTGIIADRLAEQDGRINVIHKLHENTLQARKIGVYESKGEYVINLDSDDYLDISAVEFFLRYASYNNADIVTAACYVKKDGSTIVDRDHLPEGNYSSEQDKEFLFRNLIFMGSCQKYGVMDSVWGKLIRRKLLLDFYYTVSEQMRFGEDDAVVYSIFRDADVVYISHLPVYYHIIHDKSVTKSIYLDFFKDISDMRRLIINYYRRSKYYEYIKKQVDIAFIRLCFWGINNVTNIEKELFIPEYALPDYGLLENSRIILYGAGKVGRSFYKRIDKSKYNTILWVDKKYKKYNKYRGMENVRSIDCIKDIRDDYDYVILAVLNKEVAMDIKKMLVTEYAVEPKCILWKETEHFVDNNVDWDNLYDNS